MHASIHPPCRLACPCACVAPTAMSLIAWQVHIHPEPQDGLVLVPHRNSELPAGQGLVCVGGGGAGAGRGRRCSRGRVQLAAPKLTQTHTHLLLPLPPKACAHNTPTHPPHPPIRPHTYPSAHPPTHPRMLLLLLLLQSKGMCQSSSEDDCIGRMDPEALRADGRDPAQLWRDYLVITSSRNAWARAASGWDGVGVACRGVGWGGVWWGGVGGGMLDTAWHGTVVGGGCGRGVNVRHRSGSGAWGGGRGAWCMLAFLRGGGDRPGGHACWPV